MRVSLQSTEAFAGVVKTPGPLVNRKEPKTPSLRKQRRPKGWRIHVTKVAERTRNTRGAGTRSFVWVAEVGRTHRARCSSGSRKASW